jgi:hypothetical protein
MKNFEVQGPVASQEVKQINEDPEVIMNRNLITQAARTETDMSLPQYIRDEAKRERLGSALRIINLIDPARTELAVPERDEVKSFRRVSNDKSFTMTSHL